MDKNNITKCCMVSIVGRPNAGKSTLTNSLVGQKFSIVTPKVQTTRTLMSGIFTEDNLQVILIDTPGIFVPQKNLERAMVKTAYRSLEEGLDFILHLIDCKKGITSEDRQIIEILKQKKTPVLAALNKIDLIKQDELLPLAKELFEFAIYKEIFMISAAKKTGITDILNYFKTHAPKAPFLYPEDEITSLPSKVLASEITREKLFLSLDRELPYNLSVETEQLESSETSIKIHQAIMVSKENHKKIILGKNGALIKQIGISARKELEEIFGKKVHLFLFVKVRENWMDKPDSYKYLGMEQP